ncbi:hypothetical protein FB451DRAFT_1469181 [Mycena latifolia]|nr:hypothetical protein FB451DRAFT_1416017 [Mycena latifolia]KAJ7472480.1 hypothetical protein FB451DRAFT_1469181 [Mycena latifolia]
MTFIINAQGPGPFTFNINLTGTSPVQRLNFSIHTDSGTNAVFDKPMATPRRCGKGGATVVTVRGAQLAASETPRNHVGRARPSARQGHPSGPRHDESVVPETPESTGGGLLQPHLVDNASQEVERPASPASELADCDDTDASDFSDFNDNEPVASFSPNCQLVTPSRKRKFFLMDHQSESSRKRRLARMKYEGDSD